MRTACLVIAILLFSIAFRGYPQESAASQEGRAPAGGIDQDITLTGGMRPPFPFLRREDRGRSWFLTWISRGRLHFFALPCSLPPGYGLLLPRSGA